MVTINKIGGSSVTKSSELRGLSTDIKPLEGIPNGSTFVEIDTSNEYMFDEYNKSWIKMKKSSGGSGGVSDYNELDNKPMEVQQLKSSINLMYFTFPLEARFDDYQDCDIYFGDVPYRYIAEDDILMTPYGDLDVCLVSSGESSGYEHSGYLEIYGYLDEEKNGLFPPLPYPKDGKIKLIQDGQTYYSYAFPKELYYGTYGLSTNVNGEINIIPQCIFPMSSSFNAESLEQKIKIREVEYTLNKSTLDEDSIIWGYEENNIEVLLAIVNGAMLTCIINYYDADLFENVTDFEVLENGEYHHYCYTNETFKDFNIGIEMEFEMGLIIRQEQDVKNSLNDLYEGAQEIKFEIDGEDIVLHRYGKIFQSDDNDVVDKKVYKLVWGNSSLGNVFMLISLYREVVDGKIVTFYNTIESYYIYFSLAEINEPYLSQIEKISSNISTEVTKNAISQIRIGENVYDRRSTLLRSFGFSSSLYSTYGRVYNVPNIAFNSGTPTKLTTTQISDLSSIKTILNAVLVQKSNGIFTPISAQKVSDGINITSPITIGANSANYIVLEYMTNI